MSKKKAAKKKAPPKKAAKVVKMKPKAKQAATKVIKRTVSPRSQVLPGMEQVRNRSLDRICEHISDVRGDLNRLRGEDKDLQGQAVRVMSGDKVTAYRHAGVELVLVPGDAHLRVRTLKVQANTDVAPDEGTDDQDGALSADEMQTPDDERLAESDGDEESEA